MLLIDVNSMKFSFFLPMLFVISQIRKLDSFCSSFFIVIAKMGTYNPDISESSTRNSSSILNHIINCANSALQSEDAFKKSMLELATELRRVFNSEYCSIGIVTDTYAEDYFVSFKRFEDEKLSKQQESQLIPVKRANLNDDNCTVCLALKSENDISWFLKDRINQLGNYKNYQSILTSGDIENICVIPIRDHEKNNYGFIQLLNTKKDIDFEHDILPYSDVLLGNVQLIKLIRKFTRLKDADFYNRMQDKRDSVDELLDSIMEYFSEEFNAAIITFRIPILNGYQKEPLFYLRRCFISTLLSNHEELKNHYYSKRFIKNKHHIGCYKELKCIRQSDIIYGSSSSTDDLIDKLDLYDKTFNIPIFSDLKSMCINPRRRNYHFCQIEENPECIDRFKRLYGTFQLRIFKKNLSSPENDFYIDFDEIKNRLSYLSKQITLLLDSIVDKYENESLEVFQDKLKNSSFIKIKDFDESCVEIIKESVHAKVCSIYRYNERTKMLSLSATTASIIQFSVNEKKLYFKTQQIKGSCFLSIKTKNNILTHVFNKHYKMKTGLKTWQRSVCVFNFFDSQTHQSPFIEFVKSPDNRESAMAVPMIKKDGTCAGVVLLLGKEVHKHSVSTTFWEHDIKHVEFIVNILTRISESDTERLTFLSQLSHELLAPVTEQVYDNDLTVNIAERNSDFFSKRELLLKIHENIDRNMLFKYIISDTEFIYSSSGKNVEYNIVKQDKPQVILLDAIRLLEKEAHAKGVSITTFIAQMPTLYFDKERMMQVFINLLRNAIRYSDSQTTITVSYERREDDFHEIRFRNFGIGIRRKEKESIFDLFHRGEAAKQKITRGSGMGLYIVRNIMRAHGGDCYVRRLNNPTEFVITLPNK